MKNLVGLDSKVCFSRILFLSENSNEKNQLSFSRAVDVNGYDTRLSLSIFLHSHIVWSFSLVFHVSLLFIALHDYLDMSCLLVVQYVRNKEESCE